MFITFEGFDGSGKTTQACLLADYLWSRGCDVLLTHEPGGTSIGELIRSILKDCNNANMYPWTEVFLFAASRAQLVHQVIMPALEMGKVVICDRFYDSTIAYQGYGRGLDLSALEEITIHATGGLVPDITFYLDISMEQGLKRKLSIGGELDRTENGEVAFHHLVIDGYRELAASNRFVKVNADQIVDLVQLEIRAAVELFFTKQIGEDK